MHGPRFSFLAAVLSAGVLLLGSISTLVAGASWPDVSLGHIVEVALALVSSGFLLFVRMWIKKQEDADRRVMDTLRQQTEHQQEFERQVYEFMGLIRGHLGLHRQDSDPGILISGERDRRVGIERRVGVERRELEGE